MKRAHDRVASDAEDQGSEKCFEDILEVVMAKGSKYSIQWEALNEVIGIKEAVAKAICLIQQENVEAWYIGACKDPYDRFFSEPNPHCRRFHCLHPLLLR